MEHSEKKQVAEIKAELETVIAVAEELIEELDVEAFSHHECKPRARFYRIRVDKHYYRLNKPEVTGAEILTVAGKVPTSDYLLFEVECGGHSKEIGLDQVVDLHRCGIEKFRTLPRDQKEGCF